jgi:hypothetical protein
MGDSAPAGGAPGTFDTKAMTIWAQAMTTQDAGHIDSNYVQ